MRIESIAGAKVAGIAACLPTRAEDSRTRCTELFGDAARAASVVATTGIASRRIADPGVTPLDLCAAAAERLFARLGFDRAQVGAVVFVSFTSPLTMPAAAALAQARLGLAEDVQAFDVGLACSGYVCGLYLAALLARQTGRAVLLLDGDVQSRVLKPDDEATAPILADAGTATLVVPDETAPEMRFAFLTHGKDAAALTCPAGGPIAMDGLAVFKFVANDISRFLQNFITSVGNLPLNSWVCPQNSWVCPQQNPGSVPKNSGVCPQKDSGVCPQNFSQNFDAFVPHQANVYLVRRLAKTLVFPPEKLWISADQFGNSASATIPVTLAHVGSRAPADRRLLLAGFGGGLSAAACDLLIPAQTVLDLVEHGRID